MTREPGATAAPVAERIYYGDASALTFTGSVTAVREVARVDGRQVWQLALDRTAFYPTSGGQPCDTGGLIATSRSGASLEVPITAVEEDDTGEVWHTTTKPLQEGTTVHGAVHAMRRRDHMEQHTGQHLLSAVLLRDFNAATVGFHMGDTESTIDLQGGALTEEQLADAEHMVNRIVAQALPVTVRCVPAGEAQSMLADGLLRKLPSRSGEIRLVEIAGVDLNACGGTHVATTAAAGPILLRGTEKVRDTVRLSFVCGGRAIAAATGDHRTLRALGRSLSTGMADVAESVLRLQEEAKLAAKHRLLLLERLALAEATALAENGTACVVHAIETDNDAAYAKLLASALVRSTGVQAALVTRAAGERADVVLAAKAGVVDCGTLLRTALAADGGRGGGSREMAQGAVALHRLPSVLASLRPHLP